MVVWHDNVHEFALNGDTWNSYFNKKKNATFYEKHKTREMYHFHFHFQYKTFTLICPSDSTDQTRELGQDPFASVELHEGFHQP